MNNPIAHLRFEGQRDMSLMQGIECAREVYPLGRPSFPILFSQVKRVIIY
jgi:hypothetical protein